MRKIICFLLISALGVLFSCSEDEGIFPNDNVHEQSYSGYKRAIVSFDDMKTKISSTNGQTFSLFSDITHKGENNYILEIDSTYIIQYSNDTLTTYTMRVRTIKDELYLYSNLIVKVVNGDVEEYVAHYMPTEAWQEAHNNNEYLPYEGDGVLIELTENESGENQGKLGNMVCNFSTEPIYQCAAGNPHGPDDPNCQVGGGVIIGYNVHVYCAPGLNGGGNESGGGGNGNGSGGGSGSGSGSGGGDLPTDPMAWDLMILGNELDDFLEIFDFYELGNFSSDPALHFDSFDDFRTFINDGYSITKNIHSEQNNERILKARINRTGLAGIDVFYKLNRDSNNVYSLTDVTSNRWGIALAYDWEQSYYSQSTTNNIITTIVEGYEIIGVQIGGIDFTYYNYKTYTIKINKITGLLL